MDSADGAAALMLTMLSAPPNTVAMVPLRAVVENRRPGQLRGIVLLVWATRPIALLFSAMASLIGHADREQSP